MGLRVLGLWGMRVEIGRGARVIKSSVFSDIESN